MKSALRILAQSSLKNLIVSDNIMRQNEVIYFESGSPDIIGKIACTQPNIVFMEMFMSQMDAIDIISYYSALFTSSKPYFAVICPFRSERLVSGLKKCGADKVLFSPCSPRDIEEVIRQVSGSALTVSRRSEASISVVHQVHRASPDPDLESNVVQVLKELGIPEHVSGYQYLKRAIIMAVEDKQAAYSVTRTIYPAIAEEFGTTPSGVERRIRHAIIVAWENGDDNVIEAYFGCTIDNMRGKPANSEFIAMVADRINLNIRKDGIAVI